LVSATVYNFWAKATWLSPLPYAVSFGALPCAIYSAASKNPQVWLVFEFILFTGAFHFLNVLKDLEWDLKQGIRGMPQRIGKMWGLLISATLISFGLIMLLIKAA
jgi:4-hydroxybenzoate polyprenyltransferase